MFTFDGRVKRSAKENNFRVGKEGKAWQQKKRNFPTIALVVRTDIKPSCRGRVRRVAPKQLYLLDGTGAHLMSARSGFGAFAANIAIPLVKQSNTTILLRKPLKQTGEIGEHDRD